MMRGGERRGRDERCLADAALGQVAEIALHDPGDLAFAMIVVAEDGEDTERGGQAPELAPQSCAVGGAAGKVAGDADEVGAGRADQVDRPLRRRHVEAAAEPGVHVGEMRHDEPLEGVRQVGDDHRPLNRAKPPGLEQQVGEAEADDRSGSGHG